MITRTILLASLALTFNCAVADEHEKAEPKSAQESATEEKACFNRRQVRSFDGLSDEHVYIKEGANDHFLLTMRNRCSGLRDARGIGIKDTMSRICSNSFAEIIYRDMGRMQRCRIGDIERVENKDDAEALVAERQDYEKRKKDKKKDED